MRELLGLCAAALAAIAPAQPFGRFGYGPVERHMGFRLDKDGFRAEHVGADRFSYFTPTPTYRVTRVTMMEQVAGRAIGPMSPDRVRCTLTAPGFDVYVPAGLGLRVGSTAAPYLSWTEGSVGAGVETPRSRWIVVSFRDQQPPIVLGFIGSEASVTVRGAPGDWEIRTNFEYQGWIRIGLPLGVEPRATFDAATLGRLTRTVRSGARLWTAPAPEFRGLTVQDQGAIRTVTASFSTSGALIPPYWLLARDAGFPLEIETPHQLTSILSPEGPVAVAERSALVLRLQNPRLPQGRALTLDAPPTTSLGPLAGLWGGEEVGAPTYEKTISDLVRMGPLEREPITGQVFGYDRVGRGIDLLGHQVLWAAVARRSQLSPDEGAFAALNARFDWWTGGFAGPATEEANSLARLSLANSLMAAPSRVTALAEVALVGRERLVAWTQTKPLPPVEPTVAPWAALRRALNGFPGASHPLAHALRSPWRIRAGEGFLRTENGQAELVLNGRLGQEGRFLAEVALPEGVEIAGSSNTTRVTLRDLGLGWTEIVYTRARPGPVVLKLAMIRGPVPIPAWVPSLDAVAASPR